MSFLLDSDFVIDYFTSQRHAQRLMPAFVAAGLAINIIIFIELREGILSSANRAAAELQLATFMESATLLPLDLAVAQRTAELRVDLRARRSHIQHRAFDLVIAATALEHDLVLVSANTRDYEDIPGLKLLNPRPCALAVASEERRARVETEQQTASGLVGFGRDDRVLIDRVHVTEQAIEWIAGVERRAAGDVVHRVHRLNGGGVRMHDRQAEAGELPGV